MESTLQIMPVQRTSRNFGEYAEEAVIIEEPVVKSSVSFLDANTNPVTLEELTTQCVVPTWANQELTIAHQDFISCVHDAASSFYAGETVNAPDIRCSHIVRAELPKVWARKPLNCWNVRKHNSIKDLLLHLQFQLFMRQ